MQYEFKNLAIDTISPKTFERGISHVTKLLLLILSNAIT